jgi:hypothetical protein
MPVIYRWYWYKDGISPILLGQGNPPNFSTQGLYSGKYSLETKGSDGCKESTTFFIGAPDEILTTFTEGLAPCNNQGVLTASASPNITGNYSFTWDKPSQKNIGVVKSTISNLGQGVYTVYVERTQDKRCGKNANFTFIPKNFTAKSLNAIVKNTCAEKSNGSITIRFKQPVNFGNIQCDWSHSTTLKTPIAENLSVGNYTVTITDVCGQKLVQTYQINNAAVPIIRITGACDDMLIVENAGATAPIKYLWSNGAVQNSISNATNGTYSVTATDGNGCSAIKSQVVDNNFNYQVLITNQPCEGMAGSGSASIWFDGYVKQPLTVSLGTSIVPVQELTLLSGTYFYADFTLDPYKDLYPTVSMGSCIVYPKIIVGQKKLDNIFTSYDQAKKICSYDLMCNNNKIATNQYSSYWGPAEGGFWQKCKHKLYCTNYQDGGKPFEVGSESFPKQTNKVVKYLLILTIAHDNFLIDDATFAARIKEIEKLSYCDKVRFCTTLGYNGLQIWEKISLTNHLEGFGNLSKNITNLGNGCYVVD